MLAAVAVVNFVKAFRFNEHLIAIQQGCDAFLARFGALRTFVFGGHGGGVIGGLFVGGNITFEVSQDDLVIGHAQQVIGHDRDLSTAARRVDDILGHSVARGVPAQPFHDLDALADGRAEMTGAVYQVALVEVVRADTDADQVLHQLALDMDVVVDSRL